MFTLNDEPTLLDALEHNTLAKRVGHRILKCDPPYVIGVCGSWGAGKTSFLHKLRAYLGDDFETPEFNRQHNEWSNAKKRKQRLDDIRKTWFGEERQDFDRALSKNDTLKRQLEIIWFNPWQHQFEASPLIALLHEIRRHFTLKSRMLKEAGKLTDVVIHSVLNTLTDAAKALMIPSAKTVMERGREYETEHLSTQLTSQRFRELFESAIDEITDNKGQLVIFIDDLDRCEGDTAYRLLESLKLYLNTKNCVYVLGLDQQHLEKSIAKALAGEHSHRPIARDYLSKIFQNLFHLPVPRMTTQFVAHVAKPSNKEDREDFEKQLATLFGFKPDDWPDLIESLDANLPHNPRRMKSFITSWRLHLDALPTPPAKDKLDWRLSLVLHYLAQFEEPLFRKVEESPHFYNDVLVKFCESGERKHYLVDVGLELPFEMTRTSKKDASPSLTELSREKGGYGTPSSTFLAETEKLEAAAAKPEPTSPYPRVFWISRLIKELALKEAVEMPHEKILRHLLHSGGSALDLNPDLKEN